MTGSYATLAGAVVGLMLVVLLQVIAFTSMIGVNRSNRRVIVSQQELIEAKERECEAYRTQIAAFETLREAHIRQIAALETLSDEQDRMIRLQQSTIAKHSGSLVHSGGGGTLI